MKRLLLTMGLVAIAAISAACSSAAAKPLATGPVDPSGPTLVARDMAFSPSTVEIAANKNVTIHFDNLDSAPHNVRGGPLHSKTFGNGGSFTFTPKKAETISYVCTIHPNMTAKLTVTS